MPHIPQNQEFDSLQIVFEKNPTYLRSKRDSFEKFKKVYIKTKPSFWESIVLGYQSLFRQTAAMGVLMVTVMILGFGFVGYLVSDFFNLQPDISHNVVASDDCNLGIKYPREISGFPVKVNQVKTEDKTQINISGQDKVSDDSTVRDLNIYCYNEFSAEKQIDSKNFEMKALSKEEFVKNVPSLGLDNVSEIQEMVVAEKNSFGQQFFGEGDSDRNVNNDAINNDINKITSSDSKNDSKNDSNKEAKNLTFDSLNSYQIKPKMTDLDKSGDVKIDKNKGFGVKNLSNNLSNNDPSNSANSSNSVFKGGESLESSSKNQNTGNLNQRRNQKNNLRNIFFKQDGKVRQIQFLDQASIGGDTLKGVFANQIKLGPENRVVIQNSQADVLKYKNSPLVPTSTHSVAILDSCNLALKYQTSSPDTKKILSINYPKTSNQNPSSSDSNSFGSNGQNLNNGQFQDQIPGLNRSDPAIPKLPDKEELPESTQDSSSLNTSQSRPQNISEQFNSSLNSSKNPDLFENEIKQEGVEINNSLINSSSSSQSFSQGSQSLYSQNSSSYSASGQNSSGQNLGRQNSDSSQNTEYKNPEKLQHIKVIRQYDLQETVSIDCFDASTEQDFLASNENVKSLQPFKPYFFDPETFASIQNYKIYKVVNPKNVVGLDDILNSNTDPNLAQTGQNNSQVESQWVVFFEYEGIFYQIKFYFIDTGSEQTPSSYITPDVTIQIDSLSPSIGQVIY